MLAIGTLLLASVGIAAGAPPSVKAAPRAVQASTYDEAACDAAIEAALSDDLAPLDQAVQAGEFEAECAPLVIRALDQFHSEPSDGLRTSRRASLVDAACSLLGELPRACEAPARRLLLLRRPDTLRARFGDTLRASADGPRCLPDCAPPSVRDPSAPLAVVVAPRLERALVATTVVTSPESAPRDPPRGRLERPPR